MRVAVLVASKDGASTIGGTVASAVGQADVFVVSDGSRDRTGAVARAAGAHVIELAENVGKPAGLHQGLRTLPLAETYDAIAILDDDTTIAPNFIRKAVEK